MVPTKRNRSSPLPPSLLLSIAIGFWCTITCAEGWAMLPSNRNRLFSMHPLSPLKTASALRESKQEDAEALPDFSGKTLFQRTFYRLTSSAKVAQPNSIVVEERLRFQADSVDKSKARPMGGVTYILREGTDEDEITDEIFRLDVQGMIGGSSTSQSMIATILFLASNPQICQGTMLQLAAGDSGVAASILGCIGAGYAADKEGYKAKKKLRKQRREDAANAEDDPLLHAKPDDMLPPSLARLILSDESSSGLQKAYEVVKSASLSPGKVTIQELLWSRRPGMMGSPSMRNGPNMNGAYRTIVGCDMPYSFPSAKELARCVAHGLLPSDLVAQAQVESGSKRTTGANPSSGGGGGFLGMGDDVGTDTAPSTATADLEVDIDPAVPPAFVHIAAESTIMSSEDAIYLRQFLEQGYRMTVSTNYFKMERLSFHYQTLETIAPTLADEAKLDDMELELVDEGTPSYQSLIAIHHPDYAGDGSGELFFPIENGSYKGGSRGAGTYLEPETEGGSFMG
mmetsp:Transcript_22867/g.64752  ORF Transcript_22867/g.64752 Transcript_22867/m.64752 type:complete len:513 (-) Transcript_22867:660-2198(-)